MRSSIIVFAVVGLAGVRAKPVHAQAPAAVVADPPVDPKFPPGVTASTVPRHGEDTADAVCTAAVATAPRDVVIGHGFGGCLGGGEASHDPDVKAVGIIAAVNLGKINTDPKEKEERLKRWEAQLHPIRGATAPGLFSEAERHAKEWDYVHWADALRGRPVLLVEADDQNHADMEALAAALREKGAIALDHEAVSTDHSFSDHRIALQTIVVKWLEKVNANGGADKHS